MSYIKYPILEEAYNQYQHSSDRQFTVLPKSPEYLLNVIRTMPELVEKGFVSDVTSNIIDASAIRIVPVEHMSFTITPLGIEYVRINRNS